MDWVFAGGDSHRRTPGSDVTRSPICRSSSEEGSGVPLPTPYGGGLPDTVPERSCEVRLVGKAAGHCDLGQRFIAVQHHIPGALRAAANDMARECLAEADPKCASKV
jgi:hypothetical protein